MPATLNSAEAEERALALLPTAQHVDRMSNTGVTPDDIFLGIQNRIVEALSYDYDSLYYLILLSTKRATALVALATARVASITATIPHVISAKDVYTPIPVRAVQLADLLEREHEYSNKTEYVARVQALSTALAKEVTSSNVPMYTPDEAKDRLALLLAEYTAAVAELLTIISNIRNAVRIFALTKPELAELANQTRTGAKHLRAALEDGAASSTLAVDALLLSGLVQSAAAALDLTANKYDGTVTQGAAVPATIYGACFPRVVLASLFPVGETCSVLVDGVYAGTVTAPVSPVPVLSTSVPSSLFSNTEQGSVGTGTGLVFALSFVLKNYVAASSVSIRYIFGGAVVTVTDNGIGGWSAGAGAINYSTGVVTFTPATAPDITTTILCTYTYSAVGDLRVRNALGVLTGTFSTAKCTVQNTEISRGLLETPYTSLASLAVSLSLSFLGDGVSYSTSTNTLLATGSDGGSAAQLRYPVTITPVLNTAFGAPTWITPPVTVNDVLGASYNNGVGRALGEDTLFSDVVLSGAAATQASLTTRRTLLANNQTATVALASADTVTTSAVLAVGDLLILYSPVVTVHTVTVLGVGSVTVYPEVPFYIDSITGLPPATLDISFDIERPSLAIVSDSTAAASSVAVTAAGLGFSGSAKGTPSSISVPSTDARVVIRPGDRVYQAGTYTFDITDVSATSLFFTSNVSVSLPVGSVSIHGLGRDKYLDLLALLSSLSTGISALGDGTYVASANAFALGGTGHKQYATASAAVSTALSSIGAAIAAYDANKTEEVDSLLSFLKEENLQAVISYVIKADVQRLLALTPDDISFGATVEQLAADLSAFLSTDDIVDINEAYDTLQDYFVRPEQKTYEEF